MGTKLRLVGVVLDGREKFQARRDAAARKDVPKPIDAPMSIGKHTHTPTPSLSRRPSRPPPVTRAPAFGGISLSETEALVLLKTHSDSRVLFTIIRAPLDERQMDEYTTRFAVRGWNACSVGSGTEQRVIRVELRHEDHYTMLTDALRQLHGPIRLSYERIATVFRYVRTDPVQDPLKY